MRALVLWCFDVRWRVEGLGSWLENLSAQLSFAVRRLRDSRSKRPPVPIKANAATSIPPMLAPVKARPWWLTGVIVDAVGDAVDPTVPPAAGDAELCVPDVPDVGEPVEVPVDGGVPVGGLLPGGVPVGGLLFGGGVDGSVVVVVVVVVEVAGAPSWQPDTVRTECSVPANADAEVNVAPSGEKTTKCTEPLPLPCCAPLVDVSPAGENAVLIVKGPVSGEVRMNNHAC